MGHSYDGGERRKHLRIAKSYSLFYQFKESSATRKDESFTKDISKGGLRFTTSYSIKSNTSLIFDIGVPYIAPKRLTLEGYVISCREISPDLVYEVRVKFFPMYAKASELLDMIEKRNIKDSKTYGLH